jgi:hypothetical protein
MFVGKAGSLPWNRAAEKCFTLVGTQGYLKAQLNGAKIVSC